MRAGIVGCHCDRMGVHKQTCLLSLDQNDILAHAPSFKHAQALLDVTVTEWAYINRLKNPLVC